MRRIFERYLVPGLVIQAVLVGGGYSTGRELIEFFFAKGPATGLVGMALTATLFSVGCMISFELARRYRTFDYRSFVKVFAGPMSILFEIGYVAGLFLVLSVVAAAGGQLLFDRFGVPRLAGSAGFMAVVGLVVFFGNRVIERIISTWSLIFYLAYGTLFAAVAATFGDRILAALSSAPIDLGSAVWNGASYTSYNITVLPALIFVARVFETRREALVAGALAGPLILMPGFAALLSLSAFFPAIKAAPLPISVVLDNLGLPALTLIIELVILGALVKTGAGLLHGFNERLSRSVQDRGGSLSGYRRTLIALGFMVVAVYFAARFGVVALIARGYRYSALFFLLVFVLPLLTRGLWLVLAAGRAKTGEAPSPRGSDGPGSGGQTRLAA